MKKILLSLTLALTALSGVANTAYADTLVVYDFTGTPRNSPAAQPSTFDPGITPSPFTRGPGLGNTTTTSTGFLDANGFAGTRDQAVAENDYFTFSVSAASSTSFTLDALSFNTGRSSSGPANYFVRTSADSFMTFVESTDFVVPVASTPTGFASTSFGSSFVNITTPVEFRIFGFGATTQGGVGRVDNVMLTGTTASTVAAVPEPSTYALFAIGLGGIAFALRRKKVAEGATACASVGGSGLRPC